MLLSKARSGVETAAKMLPLSPWTAVRRLPKPVRDQLEAEHVRGTAGTADRLGLPTGLWATCSCGWTGPPAVSRVEAIRDADRHFEIQVARARRADTRRY